eukprot:Plantae.Rhodophyta-Rhodochaete_pulchella.ctg2700.p1 GENE.Plantae.Rhodophyta-Rhodochaete_pulchella.ctg2700~~Plantae.Rhodophyta-Rhodochaete_pulchella.ctg2700.p1  ORF type:complete len:179 (+),score=26.22 Plantae.Rhodophyta-Rhodochaete_pulchella.ctg2700:1-537(+)
MLYDLAHVVFEYPKLGGLDMFLHHIFFLVGAWLGSASRTMVFPFGWLLLTELSTIFLNLRWFLIKTDHGDGKIMTFVAIAFAVTFGLSRVVTYAAGTFHFIWNLDLLRQCTHRLVGEVTLMVILFGQCINALWFVKIVKIALRGGKREDKYHKGDPKVEGIGEDINAIEPIDGKRKDQ